MIKLISDLPRKKTLCYYFLISIRVMQKNAFGAMHRSISASCGKTEKNANQYRQTLIGTFAKLLSHVTGYKCNIASLET